MKNSRIKRLTALMLCVVMLSCSSGCSAVVGSLQAAENPELEHTDGPVDTVEVKTDTITIAPTSTESSDTETAPAEPQTPPENVVEDPVADPDGAGSDLPTDNDVLPGGETVKPDAGSNPSEDVIQDPAAAPDDQKPDQAADGDAEGQEPGTEEPGLNGGEIIDGQKPGETEDGLSEEGEPSEETELTEEQQQQLDAVLERIAALPTEETIRAEIEALGEDEDAYNAYYMQLSEQVKAAYDAYMALGEELQQYVVDVDVETMIQLYEQFASMTLGEPEEEVTHEAHITSFEITSVVDGTTPFDNHFHTVGCYDENYAWDPDHLICRQTEYTHIHTSGCRKNGELICGRDEFSKPVEEYQPGDDRSADNKVVRTFDSVNYKFRVAMDTYVSGKTFNDARVKLEVILPLTKDQATFNLGAMTWMDTDPAYVARIEDAFLDKETNKLTVIDPENPGGLVPNCQVPTCYKHLVSGRSVIPGFFENNVSINVRSMKNGDTFAPIFYAVLENNHEYGHNDGPVVSFNEESKKYEYTYGENCKCSVHNNEVEKFRADTPEIKVSAAPKYNIRIAGGDSERRQYNFNEVQRGATTTAANQGKGLQTGRIMRLGVTVQLYNDNASKGIKGIEFPDEKIPIEFDLKLESLYQINTPNAESSYEAGAKPNVTNDYTPLLWSCGPNVNKAYGEADIDGRLIYDTRWGEGCAPYSRGDGKNACKESGTWEATQEEDVIHGKISDYSVDMEHVPLHNRGQDEEMDAIEYGKNIRCFSSGVIWIMQPFNRGHGLLHDPLRRYVRAYAGAGGGAAADAGAGTAGVNAPDEPVPQDAGPEELIDLDDGEVPLADQIGGIEEGTANMLGAVAVGVTAAAALLALAVILLKRRRKAQAEESEK